MNPLTFWLLWMAFPVKAAVVVFLGVMGLVGVVGWILMKRRRSASVAKSAATRDHSLAATKAANTGKED